MTYLFCKRAIIRPTPSGGEKVDCWERALRHSMVVVGVWGLGLGGLFSRSI